MDCGRAGRTVCPAYGGRLATWLTARASELELADVRYTLHRYGDCGPAVTDGPAGDLPDSRPLWAGGAASARAAAGRTHFTVTGVPRPLEALAAIAPIALLARRL